MQELFFELIRIAVGTQSSFSRQLTADDWDELYQMAKKQSLVGICYAALPRLGVSAHSGYAQVGLMRSQYFRWAGSAAKIVQRNDKVSLQCGRLQQRLASDGLRAVILKGQGLLDYYGERLRGLRQAGDIDVWPDASRQHILEYVNSVCPTDDAGKMHVGLHVFSDTEVEMHFTPSRSSNRRANSYLQAWFERKREACLVHQVALDSEGLTISTPTVEFNLLYLMHHIFRHYLYEGIGLRQLTDYYLVLKHVEASPLPTNVVDELRKDVRGVGMLTFAAALFWVLGVVYVGDGNSLSALSTQLFAVTPDAKRGQRLLEVVMEGGNFGHFTDKYKVTGWDKPWSRLSRYIRRNWYMLHDYPDEILSSIQNKFLLSSF